jgi:prolyl-tRNA synthetase
MRFSQALIPTLKETPRDAEVISHQLMLRAGLIRKVAAGIYTLLPLGVRVIRKFETIVREEMNRSGAQEVIMPMVIPASLWQQSGRWTKYGPELLRFKDRHDNDFLLGPTHEEVVTDLVSQSVKSYRDLPLNLYQIQSKFRDERRPRFGLMRGREFGMKDAYSFHSSWESLDQTYEEMRQAYVRIFSRCELRFRMVQADSGAIGGSVSAEFMVLADTGEDGVITCTHCDYAANVEAAACAPLMPKTDLAIATQPPLTAVVTPGKKSVSEVADFLNVSPNDVLKTMIYLADNAPVAALVCGHHEVNEIKLKHVLGVDELVLASESMVKKVTQSDTGYAGPVGLSIPIIADRAVMTLTAAITGANQNNQHMQHVVPGRDFVPTQVADIRNALSGETCSQCQTGQYDIRRGIEVGHIFKLGLTYSEAMGCTFADQDGSNKPMIMGCYGVGIGRTLAAAIEQSHDEKGIVWPNALAPFDAILILANAKDPALLNFSQQLYQTLQSEGVDILFDDRLENAGIKFKDADLIGIPFHIIVGKTWEKEGLLEIKNRRTGEIIKVTEADLIAQIKVLLGR